ncbi:unnamed protein product [Clonostachys solani]|uniref:Zn(2)-C6 fungal-type domain-containing protein n=1 Tax=Clonostachys solani TaxID=160281 RepID=A0A9N9WAL0_9HYPO|nr:unnamed protein product [Clonostachys solani]
MTSEFDPAPKRTRESTSRARTGCSTCKSRRVKCDEAKPICRRCEIGGRSCEYKAARAPQHRNVITVYLPPTRSQPPFFINERGLDYFHLNLAAKLDAQSDSSFWSKLVLQLSHSEPSVRHAVSAISVIYQDVESSLREPLGYVEANREAQREWIKAVRTLSARIQAQPDSNLVPLVCCLLFTCIELLKGNVESSLLHAQNGFNILGTLRYTNDKAPSSVSSPSSTEVRVIEDHIVPMFSRLNVLCSLANKDTPSIHTQTPKEGCPHDDLTDSRRRLFNLSDTCIRFIRDTIPEAAKFRIGMEDLATQIKLVARLETWRSELDDLIHRTSKDGSTVQQDLFHVLLVNYKVVYIWLRVCTEAGETAPDSYHADFQELVHHAEQVTSLRGGTASPQPLSFDIQILGPLFFAVLKCRYPTTRRRALEVLKLAPRREGVWNAHHAYLTAKRVIELEERHLNGRELPDEVSRLHGLPLPDDKCRIHIPGEVPLSVRNFDPSIMFSPAYPVRLETVFHTKPWGLLGDFQMMTEYINP